jgi:hypothetical protein
VEVEFWRSFSIEMTSVMKEARSLGRQARIIYGNCRHRDYGQELITGGDGGKALSLSFPLSRVSRYWNSYLRLLCLPPTTGTRAAYLLWPSAALATVS